MPFPRDRKVDIREQWDPAVPLPPLQVFCMSGLERGIVDIRWTSPHELPGNGRFNIIGTNLYRSFDSEYGPYYRLNMNPIGSLFWRDKATTRVVLAENVAGSFVSMGAATGPNDDYVFRTAHYPIVIEPISGGINCVNMNVQVTVNGVQAAVDWIDPVTGTVRLSTVPKFDVAAQQLNQAVLPSPSGSGTGTNDSVLINYRYVDNILPTNLDQRIFYRVTTLAYTETGALIETPLNRASQANNREVEKLNYIWREAIRRNRWILDQGGERVKVMIRKNAGLVCGCNSDVHGQPQSDCSTCFGTGFIGGYDGPYDITIAPDQGADKSIKQDAMGRTLMYQYETWTGPSPLLTQRDFIVKLNGDRYGIGPVRMPSNRGMQLQQSFLISHLDEPDIRYKISAIDPSTLTYPQTRYTIPGRGDATPMITESHSRPDEREERGNTVTFENSNR